MLILLEQVLQSIQVNLPLSYFAGFPVGCFGDVFCEIVHTGLAAATLTGFTSYHIFMLVVFDRADIDDAAPLFVEPRVFLEHGFSIWDFDPVVQFRFVVQVLADDYGMSVEVQLHSCRCPFVPDYCLDTLRPIPAKGVP